MPLLGWQDTIWLIGTSQVTFAASYKSSVLGKHNRAWHFCKEALTSAYGYDGKGNYDEQKSSGIAMKTFLSS